VYVSTACIPGTVSLQQRLNDYRSAGFSAIELGAGVHVSEGDMDWLIQQDSCHFLIHNYFPPPAEPFVLNLASRDATIRERSLDLVKQALELTARINAPFYSVHAGFITDPVGFGTTSFIFPMPKSESEVSDAKQQFVVSLNQILLWAKQLGVRLLIENNVCTPDLQGKLLLQTGDEFLELFKVIPDPALGILVDTGHLNVSAHTIGFDCVSFIDMVKPYICAFHIHENNGNEDTHTPITVESWVVDVLQQSSFSNIPVVIEAKFQNIEKIQEHVDWLQVQLGQ
jgi:sugar phosphate isomerase/epimerase